MSNLRVYKPNGSVYEQDCDYWIHIRVHSRDGEGNPNAVTMILILMQALVAEGVLSPERLLKVVSPDWSLK